MFMKYPDKEFNSIDDNFPFYAGLIPLNGSQEKKKFFSDHGYNPQFKYYRDPDLLAVIEKQLSDISIPDDMIGSMYSELKTEYIKKIALSRNIGCASKLTDISIDIYGDFSKGDILFADDILNTYGDDKFVETVTASEIRTELEKEIKNHSIRNWKVLTHKNIASKVTVKPRENTVYVKKDYRFFPNEIERLKTHEILVHLFRAANGEKQEYGIFKRGFAGYLEAEEGLAVYYENLKKLCDSQQMKIYAGRLKAVELAMNYSFSRTCEILMKWFPLKMAYRFCERAKRGLTDTSRAGALTKDIHYITGYLKIKDIIRSRNVTEELFTGKIGLNDIDNIRTLLDRGLIIKPIHLP